MLTDVLSCLGGGAVGRKEGQCTYVPLKTLLKLYPQKSLGKAGKLNEHCLRLPHEQYFPTNKQ